MIRRLLALAVALLLCGTALAGCDDGGGGDPDPTVPTSASSTPSSTAAAAPDITVVPATIDVPYVNAVLAALDEIDGRATRMIASTKRVPEEAISLLQAIFGDEQFLHQVGNWAESLRMNPELTGVLPNPGNRVTKVERVISASPSCVWLAVERDRSKVNVDPGPTTTEYVALQPVDPSNDAADVNKTPWAITVDGRTEDGSEPVNPCPGQ